VIVSAVVPLVLSVAGLNEQVAPVGSPEHANEIGDEVLWAVADTVKAAEPPARTVAAAGEMESDSCEDTGAAMLPS
jgi:hypothetical protein